MGADERDFSAGSRICRYPVCLRVDAVRNERSKQRPIVGHKFQPVRIMIHQAKAPRLRPLRGSLEIGGDLRPVRGVRRPGRLVQARVHGLQNDLGRAGLPAGMASIMVLRFFLNLQGRSWYGRKASLVANSMKTTSGLMREDRCELAQTGGAGLPRGPTLEADAPTPSLKSVT